MRVTSGGCASPDRTLAGPLGSHMDLVASATCRSSPTSTTARARSPTGSSSSPGPSTPATCGPSTSTRWTSSGSGASRSRPRTSGSLEGPRHQPHRHPGPRRLRLRGVPLAGRLRGRRPPRRRRPGHRGPDAGQLLPRPRERPRDRRLPQQDRPARPPTPTATPPRSRRCSASRPTTILRISAKTGEGVPELLDAVIERIPAPTGDPDAPLQALIFDSYFDQYRGVVSSVRVMNGTLKTGSRVKFMQAGATHDADEIGVRRPDHTPIAAPRARRGRLPHRRHQGRRRGPLG